MDEKKGTFYFFAAGPDTSPRELKLSGTFILDALSDGPLPIPKNWTQLVGRKLAVADQDEISNSIRRGAPLGSPDWVKRAATELNLQSTIKPRGRLRKSTGQL